MHIIQLPLLCISAWLKAEASKPRKQRRNLKQLHLELKELGYEGSYDRVAAIRFYAC
jgi:hypothetical protein